MLSRLFAVTLLAASLSGCIPILLGGIVGYEIARSQQAKTVCTTPAPGTTECATETTP